MVQGINNGISDRPIYNAVNIKIKKPEVNANKEYMTNTIDDNGIYNAVNIVVDKPSVNFEPKHNIYDYPEAESVVTYDKIPTYHVAYQTTNLILPKIDDTVDESAIENNTEEAQAENTPTISQEEPEVSEEDAVEIPVPFFTTTKEEKAEYIETPINEPASQAIVRENVDGSKSDLAFRANEKPVDTTTEIENTKKKPEIIPSEPILPEVDIPAVISNLNSSNFDTQALQMEEIARVSLDNPKNAVPYIVKEVFTNLIDITKKDTAKLTPPTDQQIEARRKIMINYFTIEQASKNGKQTEMPYQLTEKDIATASEISPMEQAERNKEYALYTMAILAKVYTDEIEEKTGNVVPMIDVPGTSAMVEALRYSQNPSVKIASIEALTHIRRPEYKEELTTLFSLAQADRDSQVAMVAQNAINVINN